MVFLRLKFPSTPIPQRFLFAMLYFCEGAPIGFIWWALPAHMRSEEIPVERVAFVTSILVLPWAFKFFWAPLVDAFQSKRWNLKSWIVASQSGMALSLVPLLFLNSDDQFPLMAASLIVHAVFAATQDVSIDALCIASVPAEQRGSMNGWMQAGMLGGRALFGGVALIAIPLVGFFGIIGGMILLIAAITTFIAAMAFPAQKGSTSIRTTVTTAGLVARRSSFWYGLGFAVAGGFAYESVGSVGGPFLFDRGFDRTTIGFFFSFPSVAAMVIGAVIGGKLSDIFGRKRSVVMMTVFIVLIVAGIAAADFLEYLSERRLLFGMMTVLYFGIGLFTAASYALFMDATDRRLGATQFSAFMGGTNLCESAAAAAMGGSISSLGYSGAFLFAALVSLISLLFIRGIRLTDSSIRDRAD